MPAGSPVYVLYYFRAWDEARNAPILCIEGLGVGLGARPFADGVDVIYYIAQENYPVEYVERDNLRPFRGTLLMDKAAELMDHRPQVELEDGLSRYVDWYREITSTPAESVLP